MLFNLDSVKNRGKKVAKDDQLSSRHHNFLSLFHAGFDQLFISPLKLLIREGKKHSLFVNKTRFERLPTREPILCSQLVTNEILALAYVGPVTESRIFGYKTNAVRSPSDIMVCYFVGTVTYDMCWISWM